MTALEEPSPYDRNEPQQLISATSPPEVQAPTIGWANIPDLLLASIIESLPVLDRLNAAQVCTSWHSACSHPTAWRRFDYGVCQHGNTQGQTRRLFDELREKQVQYVDLVETHGNKFSRVHVVLFQPESFRILEKLAEVCRGVKVCILHVHGTLRLTEDYRRTVCLFLSVNRNLCEVHLKNVEFSAGTERNSPFPLGPPHTQSLCKLSLVNSFRENNLSALMYLINVSELTVMPHQIRFTWLYHLARASLHTLNIVNMVGVWKYDFHILLEESWKQIAQGQQLRVKCYLVDLYNCSKLLCPGVPLATLVCCEYFTLNLKPLHQVLTTYADTLTTFVYYSQTERSYHSRPLAADDHILAIVQSCPKLTTLAIKDSLHSSTLLLMVQLSPNFREPLIREDMIHYQLYIPEGISLDPQVRQYTEANIGPDRFVSAMSDLMQKDWSPLPRKEYFRVLKDRYISW